MKSQPLLLIAALLLAVPGFAQSINVAATGNVGIGTATPTEKLEVAGNAKVSGSAAVGSLVVGTSTVFSTGYFESSELATPGYNGTLTVAHGLGGVPKLTSITLRCKVAELGWAVNDEIQLNSMHMVSNNHGITTAANATQIKMVEYGYLYVHTFNTPNMLAITPANWRIIVRAWR